MYIYIYIYIYISDHCKKLLKSNIELMIPKIDAY